MDINQDDINGRGDSSTEALLFKALKKNDLTAIQSLIATGADLNKIHAKNKITPLMYAVKHCNPLIIKTLIDAGADVNKSNTAGETPLIFAARNKHTLITPFLSTPGIEVNAKDHRGSSALIHAIKNFHWEAAKELIAFPSIDVNFLDINGKTALMACAEQDSSIKVMEKLLAHPSIDINVQDNNGFTALMYSANHCFLTPKKLLAHPGIDIHIKSRNGSALLVAASYDNHSMLMSLIEAGADLTERDGSGNLAVMLTHTDSAAFLIIDSLSPAEKSIHAKIMGPYFHSLIEKYNEAMLQLKKKTFEAIWAIDQGVSQSNLSIYRDEELFKNTFIKELIPQWCSLKKYDQIYQAEKNKVAIIKKKIELNRQLIDAIIKEDAPRVTQLLKDGANPNIAIQKGVTALILACQHKCHNVVKALIEAGAKINTKNKEGSTALIEATNAGNLESIKILLSTPGININVMDNQGNTALTKARSLNAITIAKLLISAGGKTASRLKLDNNIKKITTPIKNLYTEFRKHPTYYVFSGATRVAIGGLVGHGISYSLTALVAPYLAFVAISKSIAAISMLGGIVSTVKVGNILLSRFFGEIKLTADVVGMPPRPELKSTPTVGIAAILFNQDKPFITPLSDIVNQLEKSLQGRYKYNPRELEKSRTYALAYARKLVQTEENFYLFDSDAKTEVNTESYVTAEKNASKI